MVTPLDFSFDYVMDVMDKPPWNYIEIGIDVCYVLDIFVGFMTSYIDPFNGDEYFSFKRIAKHYIMQGDFFIDFLSTFWFEPIVSSTGFYN